MTRLTRSDADTLIQEQGLDIIIPDTFTSIGDMAFSDLISSLGIQSVVIPDSITTIEQRAFRNNQLTSIAIPDSVTTIGPEAFAENQLTSVVIPDNVTVVEDFVFSFNQLTSVVIPDSVTTIEQFAFQNNQLTSIAIPDSVTTIGPGAFAENQLTSVAIPDSVTTIEGVAFRNNQLTSVVIPDSVTTIEQFAFQNNQLTSIAIPDSVTTIESGAFQINQLTSVVIPDSVTSIGSLAFNLNQLTSVVIPDSVTSIASNAFANNQLTSVVIPDNVKGINRRAFANNQLTSVVIPDNVLFIGENAFTGNPLDFVSISAEAIVKITNKSNPSRLPLRPLRLSRLAFPFDTEIKRRFGESTDIKVSSVEFDENIKKKSTVARLSNADPIVQSNTYDYVLISGEGDQDNDKFRVKGNRLQILDSPDFETKSSYSVRIQIIDAAGATFEESFKFSVNDIKPETLFAKKSKKLPDKVENLTLKGSRNVNATGNNIDNVLTGNEGSNELTGKSGADALTGGLGIDRFVYKSIADSGVTEETRDVITDFQPFIDQIDLSRIDAFTEKKGNQSFTYIGSNQFTGTQGEVRFESGILSLNIDSDTVADSTIELIGITALIPDFFIL